MKSIFKIVATIAFSLFAFTPLLQAGTTAVDLTVNLNIGEPSVEVGQPFNNEITISNLNSTGDNVDAVLAQIIYILPPNTSYHSYVTGAGWTCVDNTPTDITCTYNNSLNNGDTSSILDLKINASNIIETLNPSVLVQYTFSPNADSSNDTATDSINTGKSNLHATKIASKSILEFNENFTYTISVSNPTGAQTTAPARLITISDTLPTKIGFIGFASIPMGWTCTQTAGLISCDAALLPVGATNSVVIDVKGIAEGNITNTATVDAVSADYNSLPINASANVEVQLANIELTQTLIGGINTNTAGVDSNVTYRFQMQNIGASPASDVQMTYTLPAGSTLQSINDYGHWTCSGTTCTLVDTNLTFGEGPYILDLLVTMPATKVDVTNSGISSTTSTESALANNTSDLLTHVKGADLNIAKTPDAGNADIGTNYTYTITVSNVANLADAKGVVVTDTLDSHMTYVSDTAGCSITGQVLTCSLTDIVSGTNTSFAVTVTMPTDYTGPVTNTASITTTTDQENATNLSDTATTTVVGPNLNIQKDANVTHIGLGKTFSYTITITNANTAGAVDANITDDLPAGIEILSILSNADSWNCPATVAAGAIFHCTKPTFVTGPSSITFEAKAPLNSTGLKTNTATISHTLNPNDGSDTADVTVDGITLTMSKVASATAVAGGLIDYNVTITNTSHSDANTLTLTDDLSVLGVGYTINSIINPDGWACGSSVGTSMLTCTRPLLAAENTSATIHFDVNVPVTATIGTVTNTAEVNSTTLPAPTQSASATTDIEGADLIVTTSGITSAIANENKIFTVIVTNNGTAEAKDVNITNFFNTATTANGNFTNILIDCAGGTNYITGLPYTCSLGDIPSLGSKTITISATAPNYASLFPGNVDIINRSEAVTATSESNMANNNLDWPIEVHGADLFVTKTANATEIGVGEIVTYDINISNQWEAIATNITITDDMIETGSDGFKLLIGTLNAGTGWTCSSVTSIGFTCSYDSNLSQGQSTTNITIDAQAPTDPAALNLTRSNRVTVSTATAEKETATTNTNLAGVIIRGADLNITKTVSPNPASLQEAVVFTISVTNTGLADANNTFVDDTLLAGFTAISTTGCDNDGSSVAGQVVHCTLGTIIQGQTKTFTIQTDAPNTSGNFINTATTDSDAPEAITTNNTDSVTLTVEGPNLEMHKFAPGRVAGNSFFTYTLNVQNTGLSPALGATLTDSLPGNVNYVGPLTSINANWSCSESSSVISCNTTDSNLSIPSGYNQNIVSFLVQANPAVYTIHNTAIVDTNTSESNLADNTDIADTLVIDVDLTARKLINSVDYGATENYIDINGTITYEIQVANISLVDINITDVNVTDLIPPSPKVSNVTVVPNARFTCNNPTLPGATLFCTMNDGTTAPLERTEGWISVATITVNAIDAVNFDINNENNNLITNRYKAETTLSDQQLANNAPAGDWLYTNTLVRGANMSIQKTVSSNPVGANQPYSYNLDVRNWQRTGSANADTPSTSADNIVVQDQLDANVTFVSATGAGWSCSEVLGLITCSYTGTMTPSDTASNITVTVIAPNTTGVTLSNEANVTNSTPELVRLLPDNTDNINTITDGTDITITKTGPATAGMGDSVVYTILVHNTSSVTASGIYIYDTFPNGATYDGNISNSHWTYTSDINGTTKRFDFDQNLSGGASTTFTFSSTLPNYTGLARNSVEAFTSTAETTVPNLADWDTTISGADLVFQAIPSQVPNPVGALRSHQYNVTIRNQGLSQATDINLTFNFDDASSTPGWSNVNGSGSGWSCDPYDSNNSELICHLPTLAGTTTASVLNINSTAPNFNGSITNTAYVIGVDETNTTTDDNTTVSTTINGADLKITKSASNVIVSSYDDNNVTVGVSSAINFKLSVENINFGLAKVVTVTDVFDANFTALSVTSATDWSCGFTGNTLTCSLTDLNGSTVANDIIISAISPSATGSFTNTADVNTTTVETDTSNNTDSVGITIGSSSLNVDLNASKTQVAMDEVFTYTLNIANTGGNAAVDVNVTDILDSDFTYVDFNGSDAGWNCSVLSNTVTCTQPTPIPAFSGNSILKLNVKAPSNAIGTYSNSMSIDSTSIGAPINASAPDVQVIGADIAVDISATPTDVLEDRNVTYVIHIKDINISTALNVDMAQDFTPAVTAITVTDDAGGACITDGTTTVNCSFGTLAFNDERNVTVVATMPLTASKIDPLTSQVTITTTSTQEPGTNDTDSADVIVYPIIPVAQYQFEQCVWDGTNGEVLDSIGSSHGTANGAKTKKHILSFDDNNFSTAWRTGDFNRSNNEYIELSSFPDINESRTITAWIKTDDNTKSGQRIFMDDTGANGYGLSLGGTGKIRFFIRGLSAISLDSSNVIDNNKWYFVAAVFDKNIMIKTLSIYNANGVLLDQASQTITGTAGLSNATVKIGENFEGHLDEVEIYDIALDDRAINDIYNFEKNSFNYDGTARANTICGTNLSVVKTSFPIGDVGAESNLTYTMVVTNLSDEPVTNGFSLRDILPADVTYINDSFSSNINSTSDVNLTDFNYTLPAGNIMYKDDTETITLTVKTANLHNILITNEANVTAISPYTDTATNRIVGTDLEITKTAFPASPKVGQNFIYTVTVTNISTLTNARDIVMADHFDENLTWIGTSFTSNDSSVISCAIPDVNRTIICDIDTLKTGKYVEFNITMQSPDPGTGILNEANVTSITIDKDLSNNDVNISVDTNGTSNGENINKSKGKNFNNDASVNEYGNIAMIGNTILISNSPPGTKLNDVNSTYANSLVGYTNSSSADLNILGTDPLITDDNITIEFAGLYWGAHVRGNDKNETGYTLPFDEVKFITPDNVVHNLNANKSNELPNTLDQNRSGFYHFKKGDDANNTALMGQYRIFYGSKVDITSIIRGLNGNYNGTYSVADMQATIGKDTNNWAPTNGVDANGDTIWEANRDYGYYGGWSMVVIYSINHKYHREVKFKNLSSFSGFRILAPDGPGNSVSLPITIDGFITPIDGSIDSSLFSFVQGGDKELSLESVTATDKNGITHLVREDVNNTNNIFNDTITLKDVDGNAITKSPNKTYNVGTDIDQFNLSSDYDGLGNCINTGGRPCYLSFQQQSTDIAITVSQSLVFDNTSSQFPSEQAFAQMLSMETQIFTPDFIDSYKECFKLKSPSDATQGWVPCSSPLPLIRRGDILKYRITALNTGDYSADNVTITDVLPLELDYDINSTVVTNILSFSDADVNSSICESPDYESNLSIRDNCVAQLKLVADENATTPPYTLPDGDTNESNIIDTTYTGDNYDLPTRTLTFDLGSGFDKDHVIWIEFNTTINNNAKLGAEFDNSFSAQFTNPILELYGLPGGTVTQQSDPVPSGIVNFNWDDINITVRDVGRNTVGTKIVNQPFNLDINLTGLSAFDILDANTTMHINSFRVIDINGINIPVNVLNSVTDKDANKSLANVSWTSLNTSYGIASRGLGFDMNISIFNSDNNYSDSKRFPQDFPGIYDPAHPYTGDVFSVRPASFDINLTGATVSGVYNIVTAAATNLNMSLKAPDINGTNNSVGYNASLIKGTGIDIGLDSTFSTNPVCISLPDLNISDANFTDGIAAISNMKYNEVGVIKVILQDTNWTAIDQPADCNATSGDNTGAIVSCNIDGNSSSIVFKPDHFTFTTTTVTNGANGFTYMVDNPIDNNASATYAEINTTIESKNADGNTTSFFSSTCFANDVNVTLTYDAQSKNLADLNISIANEANLTNISSNAAVASTNSDITIAYDNNFSGGTSALTYRLAVDRNKTTSPIQPAFLDATDLNGSISGYLGIPLADVSDANGTDISVTSDLYYYFGRVHAPDYRFAGRTGVAKVYYEVYCKDCNVTDLNSVDINGSESVDSINWYINTLHHNDVAYGKVSPYKTIENVTVEGLDDTFTSTTIDSGVEDITVAVPLTEPLPYKDKVEMNASSWVTFAPKNFLLEFQDDQKDWAGQGELGHIIDTNVSKRSNRRLEW